MGMLYRPMFPSNGLYNCFGSRHDKRRGKGERKKESKKRAKTKNQERIDIINLLANALSAQGYAPSIANEERIIDFGDYSISLTKHKK